MYKRPVRFEDVDAAGIVFFARFFGMCHEALEQLFEALPGQGYVGLINDRRIGFPVVHAESDYQAPLRYGDVVEIDTKVEKIGTSSIVFLFTMRRARDQVVSAVVRHTCVMADLNVMKSTGIPDDVRAVLDANRVV